MISVLVNGQSDFGTFIPKKILEKIFSKNFGNFYDFFAYFCLEVFSVTKYSRFFMPIN